MPVNVLICDDSKFARTAMARALPDAWDVTIHYAEHGQQALELIEQGKGEILFLDVNMPVLDGYQTMAIIRERDLPCMVIVVSGDVQDEARKRMLALGALEFIRKPLDNDELHNILDKYGIYDGGGDVSEREQEISIDTSDLDQQLDAVRELANIAMGKAGKNLAYRLGVFIDLPIPSVSILHANELQMALTDLNQNDKISAVSKGFVSQDIRGEALIIFSDTNAVAMAGLLGEMSLAEDSRQDKSIEVLMDVSNIIAGTCIQALAEQLSLTFSYSTPIILGLHCDLSEIIRSSAGRNKRVLAIEIAYQIKTKNVSFELLLLIPEPHIDAVFNRFIHMEKSNG